MGKRDEARAATTERILAAARVEIARGGGVGLSMRSVAREVGMVSSAVYRYFPTREDLLTALILESYGALAEALGTAALEVDASGSGDEIPEQPDADRWAGLADALREWAQRHPHEFQLIYGTPIPGYVAPAETVPAAASVAAPFLDCVGSRWVAGFEEFQQSDGSEDLHALADGAGITPSAAAAVVAAISELVGFVGHELAGHFAGLADPADRLYGAVVGRQVRDLGLARIGGSDEWGLRFVAELARALARGPGTETMLSDDKGYRVDELSYDGTHVRLIWSFPGVADSLGRPVLAGRYMDLAELRAGFTPADPDIVAGAVVINDFYPALPPSPDREHTDGIRWLGSPPPSPT